MRRAASALSIWVILLPAVLAGCGLHSVQAPRVPSANLALPAPDAPIDFLMETVDLIDRSQPIGRIGDTWWGGQYQVMLSESLKDYFEAQVARELLAAGFKVYRYPGEFAVQRLQSPDPAVRLRLELQELTLYRHPEPHLFADQVIGVCKIRGVLSANNGDVLYQRQFVGKVDTYRPTEELVPAGIGLFSRAGLSSMLEHLLEYTVLEFREKGLPQIKIVFRESREKAATTPDSEAASDLTNDSNFDADDNSDEDGEDDDGGKFKF